MSMSKKRKTEMTDLSPALRYCVTATCSFFDTDAESLLNGVKLKDARNRGIACYLYTVSFGMPKVQCAKQMKLHYSTITHQIQKIEDMRDTAIFDKLMSHVEDTVKDALNA